jgi:nondiscriminating aspartyl-tRNA synthetase
MRGIFFLSHNKIYSMYQILFGLKDNMERTYIKNLKDRVGQETLIKGFIQVIRNQGSIKFLIMRDVTGIVQTVVLKSETEAFNKVSDLTHESVIEIEGLVKEEKQAPEGYELQAKKITVLSKADPELPIPVLMFKSGDETEATKRFDWRWIDLRRPEQLQIFKLWTSLEKGFREYYSNNNFLQIYTPAIMESPSESGAEVFEVKYFDRKAYLAQSPQFHKQMAMASGFEKVFVMGPVFRAEPSFTTRHMTEFTGWDFEISYIDSHFDVMSALEDVVVSGFTKVKQDLPDVDITIPLKPFPRLTMKEVKEKLKAAGVKSERIYDVTPEEERELSKLIKDEFGHDFVFIIDYPIEARPFYHMRYADNKAITKSFDLIYRGVEVTTGAQREHRYDILVSQAKEKGLSIDSIKDYINFFKYGCPPHGGVGIGPGRLVMKMLDLPSVKEATYLPRDVRRTNP